jgi:transglutaminase-like putative cysteine protease
MIDVKYFEIPLPEDIAKEKACGRLNNCVRMIDKRIQKDIPESLRNRLLLEKQVIRRLAEQYPYKINDLLFKFQEVIDDFTTNDLVELIDDNQVDWIYINSIKHFHELAFENIMKTRKDIASRINDEKLRNYELKPKTELNDIMKKMKEKKHIHYHYRIKTTMKIKKEKPNKKIKVYLPIPLEYRQIKNVNILNVSHKYQESPRDLKARTLCIEEIYQKGMEFSVEYSYDVIQDYNDYNPCDVLESQPTFYCEELAPHIVFTPYLKSLAKEIVKEETNPLLKAQMIYDYITTHVNYSFVRSYFLIDNISEYCAKNLKGDCGLQALLFITLCRIVSVPARWQAGLYVSHNDIGNHDWAEIYIAPFGWLPVDCSFGGAAFREKNEERRQFYFTHLDPFRMVACSDFQVPFYPTKTYQRQDPYDNQTGEVEYEDEGLLSNDFETINELIEINEM